ncbi:uncharacterized protein LOC131249567 [Magnolia sinica]|uniref:uncharacterized protein LOC131249567 n=1 Tax=Magnolia sinica TaxID=86752 RepID=UPI00265B36AE|nr:uncharacterized protein LOC131249567 [Magnolia sinica]
MSSGSEKGGARDIRWKHGRPVEGNKYGAICNYCGQVIRSGGVSRLKEHLAGGYKNVKDCPSVTRPVREEMKAVLTEVKSRKLQQRDWERDMREELRGTGWGLGAIDEHDDDDDEGIVYLDDCVTAREMSDFRQVIRESRASEWEGEQRKWIDESRPSFGTSRHEAGGSSRRFEGGSRHGLQRTQNARVPDAPIAAANPHFKNMIEEVQRAGPCVKPPTPQEILGVYLDREYEEMQAWNVVQVVTDNGSAFVKAGKKLIQKFNLYWTPCIAHCIDLMLEEIGQRDSVKKTIQDARKVTNFIYNHSWLLAAMRECCGGDIVRPGATRFATNFIALDSLYRHRVGLRNLFRSERYMEWNQKKTEGVKTCSNIVLSDAFWDKVHNVVSFLHPIG